MIAEVRYALSQDPCTVRPSYSSRQSILTISLLVVAIAALCLLALAPPQDARAAGRDNAGWQAKPLHSTPSTNAGDVSCTGWDIVEAANNNLGHLYDVAAFAPNDVWAVGTRWLTTEGSPRSRTLVEHWDGSSWSVVPSPNGEGEYTSSNLIGIAAIAPDDIWAIGSWIGSIGSSHFPFAIHWDGSVWTSVDTNYSKQDLNYYPAAITAIASDDVWVVGQRDIQDPLHYRTWTMHWDGKSWSLVPSPDPSSSYNYLFDVSGSASNDVWAVGIAQDIAGDILFLHWDGTSWQQVPYPGEVNGIISNAIKAFAPDDVWAVGTRSISQQDDTPYAIHYDGTTWSAAPLPAQPGFSPIYLGDLDGSGPSDLWAVGVKRGPLELNLVLTYHWDGTAWSTVYSPTPRSDTADNLGIFSVTSAGPGHTWLVGYQDDGAVTDGAVIEQRGDPTTTCSIDYADVPSGSTFYPYVRCLSCRHILSGYPCGSAGEPCNPQNSPYFRPNAHITRGQLSKIISNAAQFASMPGPQEFEDVGPDNTFYVWVQNLASRGFIDGYACGGAGEPCVPPRNRPYFRPNATATRGQIAKIVSNSLRLADDVGTRRFEDVPEANVFYSFVQRLANRQAMGGYPCGSAVEPCVPPSNRPYFRPNNNATRGQLAKIVNVIFYTLPALSQFDNRPR